MEVTESNNMIYYKIFSFDFVRNTDNSLSYILGIGVEF